MNERIKADLKLLPDKPGCYLMKNEEGTIIYVGKAKNLKNRVSSYFTGAHNAKTTLLVSEIAYFEYIITASELESLILEINLIKNHLPKYNIKLMDDSSYPYILITSEKNPRIIVVREIKNKKRGIYFGPYPNATAARDTVNILNKIYPFRKCVNIPKKECLYYHMGQCLGPCINKCLIDYSEYINKVSKFLKGDTKEVLEALNTKMNDYSNKLEFEEAKEYRDLINSIKAATEKQVISSNDLTSMDIVGIYEENDELSIEILYIRLGSIVQHYQTIIPTINLSDDLTSFITQYYDNDSIRPKELIVNDILDNELLSQALNISVHTPLKGRKKELLLMANENAKKNYINNRTILVAKEVKRKDNIYELANLLGIPVPHVIEAFDNSNLFGDYPVSAMVSYVEGMKEPKLFRKYHVKTVEGPNDFGTMKEIIYRRYLRLLIEDKKMPDLIIMDGGEIQVNAAKEVLSSLNVNIPIIGLKKDDNHNTNVIVYEGKEYIVDKNSSLFLFLANIQQTVHDFAISFFRSSKAKGMFTSMLDGIKGLGPAKKNKLLELHPSIEEIKKLDISEFKEAGINEELAKAILEKLNK